MIMRNAVLKDQESHDSCMQGIASQKIKGTTDIKQLFNINNSSVGGSMQILIIPHFGQCFPIISDVCGLILLLH